MFATAPERFTTWLLVEHPGPWPPHDLPPGLPHEAGLVWKAAKEAGIRPQFIRRVRDRRGPVSTVITAHHGAGGTWLERRSLDDLRALADLDVDALAAGRPPGFGEASEDRVALVCTHGLKDVCCARLGRPVAVLLDQALPGQVWETNHVGGDRFAANVVTLPDGTYHGGVTTADVSPLAAAFGSRQVMLPRLRGRAGLPAPVQAAEHHLRERLDLRSLDAVRPLDHSAVDPDGTVRVDLAAHDGSRFRLHVRPRRPEQERLTSCANAGTFDTPATFDLLRMETLPPGTSGTSD
ncbi:sucrase ferredoxin [Streptomyces sp. NPDC049597]|uniref:sucrase ferredoxin n=1 Tax=Streptomyces sp. NPDC049597 TaxID=3155276 RepID=UPI00342C1632